MKRSEIDSRSRGWQAGRWLALASLLLAVGCKPGSGTDTTAATLLSHVKLTGVVELGSKRWALVLIAEPGKPTEFLKLMEGQRQGGLEVHSIDAREQSISVRVDDRDVTLSLATHGLKPQDGYAWLQRLTPDEHSRLYLTPEKLRFVDDHAQAHELRQHQELVRELAERTQLPSPAVEASAGNPP